MSKDVYGIRTAVCAKCGQEFIVATQHRYKAGGKYYCKWTCFNHRNDAITKEVTTNEGNKSGLAERT